MSNPRQDSIIRYMVRQPDAGYPARMLANLLGIKPNAVRAALGRMRTSGKVFKGEGNRWYLTQSEIENYYGRYGKTTVTR
jgi:hypothetical protein